MSEFLIEDGVTVVFAGDSITDCGRRGDQAPFGNGYVRQSIDLITARYPDRNIKYFNAGIGGNTVVDLMQRWYDDVLRHKPTVVTVKIGINDLHRGLYNPADPVMPDRFEEAYRTILTRTREIGARIVLIDPFYLSTESDPSSGRSKVLATLPEYIDVVDKMTTEFSALHVETHKLFQKQLKYRHPDIFCGEPVHPYASGHLVIAHGLLNALGW